MSVLGYLSHVRLGDYLVYYTRCRFKAYTITLVTLQNADCRAVTAVSLQGAFVKGDEYRFAPKRSFIGCV